MESSSLETRLPFLFLGRVLHESQLTFKKASTAYKEADLARQKEFLSTLSQHANKHWIALDEAAFFLNHSRKYAWSERGKPAVVRKPGRRGKMYSLILATSPEGVIKWRLVQGSINSTRFHSFLSELPNDTNVLLDNVSTHKATHSLRKQDLSTIPEVAESKRINMLYLPPYSPQLNPVELCFNFIRTSVNGSAPRTLESLRSSIQTAIEALTPSVCRSMFARTLKICRL
uniref:Tc1-like transposase DDE domain-containing protein n=1 Tax=Globisporangium ultimum (strain ATCC 200006 / CBS 805.95 / DAOM BR144) TaxID=431595 RepID=K3WTY3_GLOUD